MRRGLILGLEGRPGGKVAVSGSVRIGRDASMDVVVYAPGVASHHAVIWPKQGGWWIEAAMGASIGCNGERLSGARRLVDGDRLALGQARLLVESAQTATKAGKWTGRRRWILSLVVLLLAVGGWAHAAAPSLGDADALRADHLKAEARADDGECSGPACDEEASRLHVQGKRRLDEKALAPGHAFEAWSMLRKAKGFAVGSALKAEIERDYAAVDKELEQRCGALRFAVSRHLAMGEHRRAAASLAEMGETFPSRQHACHALQLELELELNRVREGGE